MHQNSQSRRDQRSRDHRGQQVLRSSREHRHQTNDNRKIRSCTVRIDGLSETQIFVGADWEDKTETTKAGYVPRLCPSGRRMPAPPYLTQKVTACHRRPPPSALEPTNSRSLNQNPLSLPI